MAQFVVRHLEDEVKERLKRRAARHGLTDDLPELHGQVK